MPQLFAINTRFTHKRNIDVGDIQPIEIVESDEKVAPVNLLKKLIIKRELLLGNYLIARIDCVKVRLQYYMYKKVSN